MATESAEISTPFSARFGRWAQRIGLGRKLAIVLSVATLASAIASYAALSGWGSVRTDPKTVLILLNINLVLFLILASIVARRLVQLWMERRRGAVGSRLHTRLVLLFSVVAVTPTVIVAVSSAIFFTLGVQAWFSDRVRTALNESKSVAEAYPLGPASETFIWQRPENRHGD